MIEAGKELVFVDGQEGFVSLNIPLKIAHGYSYTLVNKEGIKTMFENETVVYPFNIIPCNLAFPAHILKYLTVMTISMNYIRREYNKIIKPYARAIEALENAIELNKGHPVIISRFNKEISRLLYLQRKSSVLNIPREVVDSFIARIPSRYFRYYDERKEWKTRQSDNTYFFVTSMLEIRVQALAFLEQQVELKRFVLSKEESALLMGMKEAMCVHDDASSFDDYLHKWSLQIRGVSEEEYKQVTDAEKEKWRWSAVRTNVYNRLARFIIKYPSLADTIESLKKERNYKVRNNLLKQKLIELGVPISVIKKHIWGL